jgi:hypothetical protein
MIELNAVELVLEGAHGVAIRFHLLVMTARILHDLIDYEVRVSPNVEAPYAGLNDDSEAAEEGLVLRHIVGRGEVQAHCIPHVFPQGRDEEQARARPVFITDPSKWRVQHSACIYNEGSCVSVKVHLGPQVYFGELNDKTIEGLMYLSKFVSRFILKVISIIGVLICE